MSEHHKLVGDVDKLFNMFEMKPYDLYTMTQDDIKILEDSIVNQTDEICQGAIDGDYIKTVVRQAGHIITLSVNKLVIGMSILTEKLEGETRYMEVDILCSRKFSGTGRQILIASENLARSMMIGSVSLSSLPMSIGFYRKMGYLPVPIFRACENAVQVDLDVLNIYDHARYLLAAQPPLMTNNKMGEEVFNQARSVLLKMGLSVEEYRYLLKEYPEIASGWNDRVKIIEVEDLFEDGNLMMTKCLWNNPQGDLGLLNVQSKRRRSQIE